MLSLTGILLATSVAVASQADALEQVQAQAIGKRERSLPNGNKLVKEIGDAKETLSLFQPDGSG